MEPLKKYKSFQYATNLQWTEGRQGIASSAGKQDIPISSPPEFKGTAGFWTPEDMFVSSIEMCTMATFLSFAERKGCPVKSYSSSAEGLLEFTEGNYRFTKVTVRVEISVGAPWTKEQTEELLHSSHKHCLIANSVTTHIEIIAAVTVV